MNVVFSIGVRIPGEGMGNHGYHTAEGLSRHNMLKRALVMRYHGSGLAPEKVRTFYLTERISFRLSRHTGLDKYLLRDNLFDWWVSHQLRNERGDVFYGWNHIALWSIKKAKRLGMLTILERANSHPLTYTRLLEDEYRKYQASYKPYHPLILKKHLRELEETDYIAVTSEFTKQGLLEHGLDAKRILLTPLGVNTEQFTPKETKAPADDVFRVVFVGQLCLRKGVQYLLEAWEKLRLNQAELILVGDLVEDLADMLKTYRRRNATISVRPHTSDPAETYREASVFILPSLEDGFGLVVLEAMACGVPVIVTEHTGAKDCVRPGLDGFVLPACDSDSIADTLRQCAQNPSRLDEMGRNARQQAEYYSWQRYQDGIIAHLKRIAD